MRCAVKACPFPAYRLLCVPHWNELEFTETMAVMSPKLPGKRKSGHPEFELAALLSWSYAKSWIRIEASRGEIEGPRRKTEYGDRRSRKPRMGDKVKRKLIKIAIERRKRAK